MTDQRRLYGLDLIRFLSLLPIIQFHTHEAVYFTDALLHTPSESFHAWIQPINDYLSFSGLTIVALSAFLFGLSQFRTRRWITLLLLMWCGLLVLALLEAGEEQLFYFEWDIYPYLLVCFSFIFLVQRFKRLVYALGALGFILLWIPFWKFSEALPAGFARDALFGDCVERLNGSWPLLPWIGLPLLFFSLGRCLRASPSLRGDLSRGSKVEWFFWPAVLLASVPFLGAYHPVPMGPNFYCHVHTRSPLEFYSHLLWIVFLMRLSLLTTVNDWLAQHQLARFISSLRWSRNFGMCYLLQFTLLMVAAGFTPWFELHPRGYDVLMLSVLPLTELLCRGIFFLYNLAPGQGDSARV